MTTSGLVVTLHPDPELAAEAVRDALLIGPFTLGEQFGHRLAMALQADSPADAEYWHGWLVARPGVVQVEVAFVHMGEEVGHVG
ncbi:MAG TPA: hypothetical protein VM533_04370 [Fimbriiglobus sp.]|jgi:hypothetical protein|nr:hypothetical protein [Fimbriiglobus sp.]